MTFMAQIYGIKEEMSYYIGEYVEMLKMYLV